MSVTDTIPLGIEQAAHLIPLGIGLILPNADFQDIDRLSHSPDVADQLKAVELYGMIWGDCISE